MSGRIQGRRPWSARRRAATTAAPMGLPQRRTASLPLSPPPAGHGADWRVGALLQRLGGAFLAPPLEGGSYRAAPPCSALPTCRTPRPAPPHSRCTSTWRPAVDARSTKRATRRRPAVERHSLMGWTGCVPPAWLEGCARGDQGPQEGARVTGSSMRLHAALPQLFLTPAGPNPTADHYSVPTVLIGRHQGPKHAAVGQPPLPSLPGSGDGQENHGRKVRASPLALAPSLLGPLAVPLFGHAAVARTHLRGLRCALHDSSVSLAHQLPTPCCRRRRRLQGVAKALGLQRL